MPGQPSQGRPTCRGITKAGNPCRAKAAAGSAYCAMHGGAARKIGAPTKLTPEVVGTLVAALERGAYYDQAAAAAGIHESTLHGWRDRGTADLEAGGLTAERSLYAHLVEELTRAQAAAEVFLVTTIRTHASTDWRAAAWLLERRHPQRWGRRDHLDVVATARAEPRLVVPEEGARAKIIALLTAATAPPAERDA